MKNLCISGDSILRGVILNGTGRYTVSDALGWDSLAKRFDIGIDNRCRFGCTITRGYDYLQKQLSLAAEAQPQSCTDPSAPYDTVLLEYGGNDSDYLWDEIAAEPDGEHHPQTPFSLFRETYEKAIDFLRQRGIRPLLATLPPISSHRYFRWICRTGRSGEAILHWLGDENAIYRHQEKYSHAVEDIARSKDCPCIDLRSAFLEHRHMEDFLCEDGIHPNPQGQQLIRETLQQTLAAV